MTEEILKEKVGEVKDEDIDETLPSSETELPEEEKVEVEPEVEAEDIPNLTSAAVPTEEQKEEAGFVEGEPDVTTDTSEDPSEIEVEASESVEDIGPEPMTEEQKSVEKMLTQSQVNELVGRTRTETRDSTLKSTWDRYGVNNDTELDDLVGRGQKFEVIRRDYDRLVQELQEAKDKLAMYDSDIAPERYEDAKLILKGKGLEITKDNILAELGTHPEWKKVVPTPASAGDEIAETFQKIERPVPAEPVSKLSVLGNNTTPKQSGSTEREDAMKWFR